MKGDAKFVPSKRHVLFTVQNNVESPLFRHLTFHLRPIRLDFSRAFWALKGAFCLECDLLFFSFPCCFRIHFEAFKISFFSSFRTVWKSILLGQLIALLLCLSSVLVQILVKNYNVRLPAGQNLIHYVLLATTYSIARCCKKAANDDKAKEEPIAVAFRRRGLRYFCLALLDSQSGYLSNAALQHTTLMGVHVSIMCQHRYKFPLRFFTRNLGQFSD